MPVAPWRLQRLAAVFASQASPPPVPASVSAAPFWKHLTERRDALENLKGLAQVQARTDKGSATLDDVVVVVRHAEALRLEGIGPFGQPLFLFVTDGEWLALHMIRNNRLTVGAASARNLERMFGIAVAPQSLLRVLLGDIPLNHYRPTATWRIGKKNDCICGRARRRDRPQATAYGSTRRGCIPCGLKWKTPPVPS